ncbi:hypothetical protein FB451DRAFT_1385464 [Mycena latifolia]|nr:hypothetical protein FB451DRAFT_1385464 [Mycena latifolia]
MPSPQPIVPLHPHRNAPVCGGERTSGSASESRTTNGHTPYVPFRSHCNPQPTPPPRCKGAVLPSPSAFHVEDPLAATVTSPLRHFRVLSLGFGIRPVAPSSCAVVCVDLRPRALHARLVKEGFSAVEASSRPTRTYQNFPLTQRTPAQTAKSASIIWRILRLLPRAINPHGSHAPSSPSSSPSLVPHPTDRSPALGARHLASGTDWTWRCGSLEDDVHAYDPPCRTEMEI